MNVKPDDIAINILANVIRALGPLWDRRLSESERELVRACCADAARLGMGALAAPRSRERQTELLREKAAIHARLADSFALGGTLAEGFWEGFSATVNGAVVVACTPM